MGELSRLLSSWTCLFGAVAVETRWKQQLLPTELLHSIRAD